MPVIFNAPCANIVKGSKSECPQALLLSTTALSSVLNFRIFS